jgi:hypothetical protein
VSENRVCAWQSMVVLSDSGREWSLQSGSWGVAVVLLGRSRYMPPNDLCRKAYPTIMWGSGGQSAMGLVLWCVSGVASPIIHAPVHGFSFRGRNARRKPPPEPAPANRCPGARSFNPQVSSGEPLIGATMAGGKRGSQNVRYFSFYNAKKKVYSILARGLC